MARRRVVQTKGEKSLIHRDAEKTEQRECPDVLAVETGPAGRGKIDGQENQASQDDPKRHECEDVDVAQGHFADDEVNGPAEGHKTDPEAEDDWAGAFTHRTKRGPRGRRSAFR